MSLDFGLSDARRVWVERLLQPKTEERVWEEAVRELFAWQYERVPAYRRLCAGHGIAPGDRLAWRAIPGMPQQLFKLENLFGHGMRTPAAIYETSGTTTGQPGRQHLLHTDIYRAVSVEGARRVGLFAGDPQFHFLTPSPQEAPHSSLSAMFGFWQEAAGQAGSRFWVRGGNFEWAALRKTLIAQIRRRQPIALAGTAFSFVHLIDAWGDLPPLRFPAGSWLLETGGFKGRTREVPKAELYAKMARLFTMPDDSIWNEYGMSELSSQAYARGTAGLHHAPAWARVLVCDPATGREVRVGGRGLVRWIDLANTDSVMTLQTLDLAERTTTGFRLMGRLPKTEPRGCSLGAEDLILGSARAVAAA